MPKVLALHAHDFEGMFRDLRALATATNIDPRPIEANLRERVERVRKKSRQRTRKRVFCLEWYEPLYCSGHWVPEMVEMAGGRDSLARRKTDSARIEWADLVKYDPEKIILMPCGFTMTRARSELKVLRARPEWRQLSAVRDREVYLTDGPSYFNSGGLRLVDGVEILAEILHPDTFPRHSRKRRGYARLASS